jgi:hypothetical protein
MMISNHLSTDRDRRARRLRKRALADFLADWQAKHGEITSAELSKARAELGYPPAGTAKRR